MRALVILAIIVAAVVAVLLLQTPRPSEAPSAPGLATSEARFLARPPEPSPRTEELRVDVPKPKLAPSAVDPPGEVSVAAAVAHGDEADLERALAKNPGYPAARAKLARAFLQALGGGNAKGGNVALEALQEASLESGDKALLRAAVGSDVAGVHIQDAGAGVSPLTRAMEMGLIQRSGRTALAAGRYAQAARDYSDVLLAEVQSPWDASSEALARWTSSLDDAQAHHRWDPRGDWPSEEIVVEAGDSPIAIRKRYLAKHPDRIMCAGLITRANAVRGHLQPKQKLRVPTDEVRMLVDISARWAFYLIGDEVGAAWPVGVGRPGQETPPGSYVARDKIENPPWLKVGQEPIPFGDPRNPLGTRWIAWFQGGLKTSYGFHGTREPETVGTACSDGCVRFRNEDVEKLYDILPEGAPILVQP